MGSTEKLARLFELSAEGLKANQDFGVIYVNPCDEGEETVGAEQTSVLFSVGGKIVRKNFQRSCEAKKVKRTFRLLSINRPLVNE